MTPVVSVTVSGVRPTVVALSAEVTSMAARATAGLVASGKEVQAKARANVEPYRYDGRLQRATTVSVHIRSQEFVQVTVGVHGRTFAPEGKTFEVGWRSSKGLQPPAAALAEWVVRRNIASGPEALRVAWVIARGMKRRGYSFGQRHWLTDAWRDTEATVLATVTRYTLATWSTQPRVPAGSAGAGRWMKFG